MVDRHIQEEMDRVYGEPMVDPNFGSYAETLEEHLGLKRHKPPMGEDMVLLPKHYSRFQIEPARFSVENRLDGLEFNIIKYVCRAPYKHNDKGKQDYSKAIRSVVMKAKYELGDPDWWKPYKTAMAECLAEELSYED